jgi:hypothetical protein
MYYGERRGEESAYTSEVYEKLKESLPDAIELDGVRIENIDDNGYRPEPSDRNYIITIQHDSLIEYLLENFEEVEYNGQIDWTEHWEEIGSVDSPMDFDDVEAKEGFFEYWIGFQGYIEKATEIYAKDFIENFNFDTNGITVFPSDSIEDIDGIIIYNGNKYKPLSEDEDNQKVDGENLARSLERMIEENNYNVDFIPDDVVILNFQTTRINETYMGFYVLDNTVKTSIDPQTMKPITEAVGYLKYF